MDLSRRWVVCLVDHADEPGRVFGTIATYRSRWLAKRRRRAEEAADVRLNQLHGARWEVVDADG
jgi:hypothetical protein